MLHPRRPTSVEDEVAGLHRRGPGDGRPGVELGLGHSGQDDPRAPIGRLGQARAVKPALAGAPPQVGRAEVLSGKGEGRHHRARDGGILGHGQRQRQHGVHVAVGVVVVVDGRPQGGCPARAVRTEHGGGRIDGIHRVVGRRRPDATGPDGGVGGEGGRFELHRAFGSGAVGPGRHSRGTRLPASRLDRAHRGQDRPRQPRTGGGGLLVEGEPGGGNGRPRRWASRSRCPGSGRGARPGGHRHQDGQARHHRHDAGDQCDEFAHVPTSVPSGSRGERRTQRIRVWYPRPGPVHHRRGVEATPGGDRLTGCRWRPAVSPPPTPPGGDRYARTTGSPVPDRGGMTMLSTMQDAPLLVSGILRHGQQVYGDSHVITITGADGEATTATFAEVAGRSERLAGALGRLGIGDGDRVGTFLWNNQTHQEAYLAVPGDGRGPPHAQPPALPRAARLRHQPRRGPGDHRRRLAGPTAGPGPRPAHHGEAHRRGRRRRHRALGRDALLRGAAGRRGAGLRLARPRRTAGRRHVLHLRHHREPQGRGLQPPVDLPALVRGHVGLDARHQRAGPCPLHRAHVPRQRLGHSLRRLHDRRRSDHAPACSSRPPRWRRSSPATVPPCRPECPPSGTTCSATRGPTRSTSRRCG